MKTAIFDTSLTDDQLAFVRPVLPKPSPLGRPPAGRRQVLNAILTLIKGRMPWHLLPHCFPPWKPVFHIFRQSQAAKLLSSLNDQLAGPLGMALQRIKVCSYRERQRL